MENDCTYFFLKETAISAWANDDIDTQNQMLVCVTTIHKETWFRRVIYKGGAVAEWQLREMAENAFLLSWEKFNEAGKTGKTIIQLPEYTHLLYKIFKNNFLKLMEQVKKDRLAEDVFAMGELAEIEPFSHLKDDDLLARTRIVLQKINPSCAELIEWRYKERLSFDEIALRKKIKRLSCVKILSRCKKHFLEVFKKNKHQPD